jgi:GTP-binding protein
MGTPIKIEFREGANPYETDHSSLNDSQRRKRRQLMRLHKNAK